MKVSRHGPAVALTAGLMLAAFSVTASAMPFCGKSGYGNKYPHPYAMNYPYGYGYAPVHPAYAYHGGHPQAQHNMQQNHGATGAQADQQKQRSY